MPGKSSTKTLKFDNEYLLQQAIAGLLSKMPHVTGVQILQGAQEYGKDIIFYVPGGLSERILVACVVKNTKLTGKAATDSGARTVLIQAQQAFDTAYVSGSGTDEWVQRVYVVTPYPIDPSASLSIQGALKERRGQIEFIGGPKLFDLFRKYWPDFVADEADAISRYIADAKDKFEQSHPISEVATLYQLGTVDKKTTSIHVPQNLARTIASFTPGDGVDRLIPNLDISWKRRDLNNAVASLLRLDSTLTDIAKWGFWDQSEAHNFHQSAVEQCKELSTEWTNAIAKKYKLRLDAVAKLSPDATTNFSKRSSLYESLANLKSKANLALGTGVDELTTAARQILRGGRTSADLLLDQRFLQLCNLTDLASSLPAGFLEEERRRTWTFDSQEITSIRFLLIVGAAGYGKTSFCRWSFLSDAEQLNCGASDRMPVYIALHKIGVNPPKNFDELYAFAVGRSGLIESGDAVNINKVRLYLDGLDEIADDKIRETVVTVARQGIDSYPQLQMVLTSRSYVQGPWLTWLPRLSLSGFTDEQIERFIREWLQGREEEIGRFKSQLKKTPALADLMEVPLIATLIMLVFRQTGRLPESRPRVYEVFIELMCEGWNLAKGLLRTSRFGLRVKKAVLSKIAVDTHRRKSRVFDESIIRQGIKSCVSVSVCKNWTELRDELLEDGLINRSGINFEFSHLSFQEFLAAKAVLGEPTHALLTQALRDYLRGDDWWYESLRFYVGLSESPRQTYNWIVNEASKLVKRGGEFDADPEARAEDLLDSVKENFPETPMKI
jgi:hypothetical protein